MSVRGSSSAEESQRRCRSTSTAVAASTRNSKMFTRLRSPSYKSADKMADLVLSISRCLSNQSAHRQRQGLRVVSLDGVFKGHLANLRACRVMLRDIHHCSLSQGQIARASCNRVQCKPAQGAEDTNAMRRIRCRAECVGAEPAQVVWTPRTFLLHRPKSSTQRSIGLALLSQGGDSLGRKQLLP